MPVEALLLPLRMPLFCSFEIIALVGCGITIVLLFSVGELSDRIPICPSGYAITVTHDGYSVVYK